ncbi:unnamed protein product, partial [Trichogramma brassicae]
SGTPRRAYDFAAPPIAPSDVTTDETVKSTSQNQTLVSATAMGKAAAVTLYICIQGRTSIISADIDVRVTIASGVYAKSPMLLSHAAGAFFLTVHNGRKDYGWDKCEQKYGQKGHLFRHQKTVHEGRKDYRCAKCEKKFGRKSILFKHQNTVHENRKSSRASRRLIDNNICVCINRVQCQSSRAISRLYVAPRVHDVHRQFSSDRYYAVH